MSIPFTQYLLPNGRRQPEEIDRPEEIETLAQRFIAEGGKFEAEVLMTGHVSLTACHIVEHEMQDIAIEVCANGPGVEDAVDRLVQKAAAWLDTSAAKLSVPREKVEHTHTVK